MKERITFFLAQGADVDPDILTISADQFHGPSVKAARENRLTVEAAELPPELARLLHSHRDVSIRWASELAHDAIEPFVSRLSPGLHVFSTPATDNAGHDL
ncbi:protein pbn1 [Metarhizium album ARSEF 1941]|uniref:Protein pbn1 n=1 Tax=Metarhizium album (strain ARSEF 1941) TaxID=1081103 RepID=A0A0B2X677_METAS|nr:protein pbn1 [Metarhizium album ARSEF 1941]KHO00781.1 protein pbn1 [Metarhizium album ARSEF 1941]